MNVIITAIGNVLGGLMRGCYFLCGNYGLAILLFTLATKVILFPLSLWIQKNSIKMVKMTPKLEALRQEFGEDDDAYLDAQTALYKQEKYSPLAGVLPLLVQIPLILGLIDVVYKPLKHLLQIPEAAINELIKITQNVTGIADLGSSPQMRVVELIQNSEDLSPFETFAPELIQKIQSLNLHFCGINLSSIPSSMDPRSLIWVPILAGISALLLCIVQNHANVLQIEQSSLSQWGMTAFLVLFSLYFAFYVPSAIGIYWIFGNLLSIAVVYLCNMVYDPRKYIDYEWLNRTKELAAGKKKTAKENEILAKADYKRFFEKGNFEKIRLVVYVENKGYYKYLRNVIEEVIRQSDIEIHYITSDSTDPMLKKHDPQIIPYYADEKRLIPMMMKLEADMVIMTTPDLDKYYIKRSKVRPDIEYVYIDHACTNMNMGYRPDAFAAFDTIFVCNPIAIDEIRGLEKLRGTKKKMIVKCGYGLIDNMIEAYEKLPKMKHEKPQIMIAPSWQEDNIMDSCIDDMFSSLSDKGWRVILRPHPQYLKRFPQKYESLVKRYEDRFGDDFYFDTDYTSSASVYESDILITDWSGIPCEFSFTTLRPSLFVNTKMKVLFPDWEKVGVEPFDITCRKLIGQDIEKCDVIHIDQKVSEMLAHMDDYAEQIKEIRSGYFYNLGHSGEVGARYIVSRLNR